MFIAYSDSTITNLIYYKAGLKSSYGLSFLETLAENNKIFDYTREHLNKILFSVNIIILIIHSEKWTIEIIEWTDGNKNIPKIMKNNLIYVFTRRGYCKGYVIW